MVLGGSSVLDGEPPVVDILLIGCPFVYLGAGASVWLLVMWEDAIDVVISCLA